MALCASCKLKVEEGAVLCGNCGAQLARPGAFQEVMGWIFICVSTIPLAVSMVTTLEKDLTPLIIGVAIFAFGLTNVLVGKTRTRRSPPTILPEQGAVGPLMPS